MKFHLPGAIVSCNDLDEREDWDGYSDQGPRPKAQKDDGSVRNAAHTNLGSGHKETGICTGMTPPIPVASKRYSGTGGFGLFRRRI